VPLRGISCTLNGRPSRSRATTRILIRLRRRWNSDRKHVIYTHVRGGGWRRRAHPKTKSGRTSPQKPECFFCTNVCTAPTGRPWSAGRVVSVFLPDAEVVRVCPTGRVSSAVACDSRGQDGACTRARTELRCVFSSFFVAGRTTRVFRANASGIHSFFSVQTIFQTVFNGPFQICFNQIFYSK